MRRAVGEAKLVPELAAWLKEVGDLRRQLAVLALAPAYATSPPTAHLALCEILLDFSAWQRLATDQALESREAETVLVDALMALVDKHGAAPAARRGTPRTKRKPR